LTSYLEEEAQTVRGMAAKLSVSKPAITRALDRLSEFDLVRRKTDPLDRRSVLVQRTIAGAGFMRDLKKYSERPIKRLSERSVRRDALEHSSGQPDRQTQNT
jgi:DNA-binding MarR family transcriptional regulator